jgi:hypothetical protein
MQDLQGSSVTSEEARTDCITSINKVVHQLISRIICVVVVIEPIPIHSIAYIHLPATYPQFGYGTIPGVKSVASTAVPGSRAAIAGAIARVPGAGAMVSGDELVPLSSESHHHALQQPGGVHRFRPLVSLLDHFGVTNLWVGCWVMDVGIGIVSKTTTTQIILDIN